MQRVYWIFGSSASGKETFIKKLAMDSILSEKLLGTSDLSLVEVCTASLELIAQSEATEKSIQQDRNKAIFEFVDSACTHIINNRIILIKGQDVDLDGELPVLLSERYPNFDYEIYFLDASSDELFQRIKNKGWFDESITKDVADSWRLTQIQNLKKLQSVFNVTSIRSEKGIGYELFTFPPDY